MDLSELQDIARARGFAADAEALEPLRLVAGEIVEDCARLDALAAEHTPPAVPPERAGYMPTPEQNPVNGWVWKCEVRGAASGPLAGRTVALKDNIALAGAPLLNGSKMLDGFIPSEDATVVTRLLDAGATIAGKTAVPAFCCEGTGIYGYPQPMPVNPFDRARFPGASSAGSAAVVANGEVDLALGADQGGSIRIPASWSGCCGLKPTFGLVPYTGIFPVELSLDTVGPMTPTVRGCAEMLAAIAGPDGKDGRQQDVQLHDYVAALDDERPLRVGLLQEGFGWPGASEPEVDDQVRATARRLAEAGHTLIDVSVPLHLDGMTIWNGICTHGLTDLLLADELGTNWRGEYWTELGDWMRDALGRDADALPPTVKATVLAGEYLSRRNGRAYYAKAQQLGRLLTQRYDDALADCDVLLMPTTPMRAVRRTDDITEDERIRLAMGLHTADNAGPFNVTGHPGLSVPCQPPGELPIGAMIVGRRFDDATVLRAGAALERARESA
jgi:amidase